MQRDRGSRSRLIAANAAAQEFYAAALKSDEAAPARQYLRERNFDARGRGALRLRIRAVGLGHADETPAAQGL